MCLIALALGVDPRFPLVVAANRDEFFSRHSDALAWWTLRSGDEAILAGRDLQGGGTWFGLTASGRLAMLTNIRDPQRNDAAAPSRGSIVTDWLASKEPAERFWPRVAEARHNGFNLIAGDWHQGEFFWAANHGLPLQRLMPGIHGLSNAALDTPWPKVTALKSRLAESLQQSASAAALARRLFDALADRHVAADDTLPDTGVGIDAERRLAPAFIAIPARGYGTRCSTVLIRERRPFGVVTQVIERSFDADGRAVLQRHAVLRGYRARTISTWAMPASSNTSPSGTKPARA